jgi:preprotein translocase subunit SecY
LQTVIALTAGTMFLIWLGEQITEKGVGNGISFLIFAGIVARLPQQIIELVQTAEWWQVAMLVAVFVGLIYIIITVTQGERRIAVKYAPRQAGNRMVQAQRSHLPLKLAAAGVIPSSSRVSIVLFPARLQRGISVQCRRILSLRWAPAWRRLFRRCSHRKALSRRCYTRLWSWASPISILRSSSMCAICLIT